VGIFAKLKEKLIGKSVKQNEKYVAGLDKSSRTISDKLNALAARFRNVDDEYFSQLEEILIEADVGVKTAIEIINQSKAQVRLENITDPLKINEILVDKMYIAYASNDVIESELRFATDGPTVVLMVGVNGVGKTTSIAKLAHRYIKKGKKVMIAAGDTFRAGAVEQLQIWADRLHVECIKGKEMADPASVLFDAVRKAKQNNIDLLICDTAGRLHNKTNLMDELAKMVRVIKKEIADAPHEILLVIDATTGQNGVFQAKEFAKFSGVSGIVLTKMDGTSKGGIILSIKNEINIPVRFICVGEKLDDLEEFDLDQYLLGLFSKLDVKED
jgi:fused signal recognition particle receptor